MAASLPGPATLPTPPSEDYKYVAKSTTLPKPIRLIAKDQAGTAPALAVPATALATAVATADAEPEPDAPPPTAEEVAAIAEKRRQGRESEADDGYEEEDDDALSRVRATRLRALKHASEQLPAGRIVTPRTPKEIAIARCGNVSGLISDDSDDDDDGNAGG